MTRRVDNDHFDLVRKTLSNFRFGEYFAEKTKLRDLERFFDYMLDHGYAGDAEAIGTDYKNLEIAGIIKVERLTGNNFRFWMLKKDVIADTRSILRGLIPFRSAATGIDLTSIESVVQARAKYNILNSGWMDKIALALRQIEEGMRG